MNAMKQHFEMQEETERILLDVGALKTCEFHKDHKYLAGMDSSLVYALATKRYKEKNETEDVPKDFRDCIKEILDSTTFESTCPYCAKNMQD